MAMRVSILRPWWDSGVPERQRNHDWTLAWWQEQFPNWEIVEAAGDSRASALNRCARESHGEILIKADVDAFCDRWQIKAAVWIAQAAPGLVYPHSRFENIDKVSTEILFERGMRNIDLSELGTDLTTPGSVGGIYIVRRELFEELGGEDEHFVGWGFEDPAFDYAALTLLGECQRVSGALWHLWHPLAPDFDVTAKTYQANRARCLLYEKAIGNVEAMKGLIA